jgi:hypothetical protein
VAPFIFRCPNTGRNVQGFLAEEIAKDINTYNSITCLACRQLHLVNPTTGKVLGDEDG